MTTSPCPKSLEAWNRSIRIPASRLPEGPELRVSVLSEIFIVVVLTVVVVPDTVKLPAIKVSPPIYRSFAIPAPPDTTKAPLPIPLLSVVFEA